CGDRHPPLQGIDLIAESQDLFKHQLAVVAPEEDHREHQLVYPVPVGPFQLLKEHLSGLSVPERVTIGLARLPAQPGCKLPISRLALKGVPAFGPREGVHTGQLYRVTMRPNKSSALCAACR